jgi:drug/metabolite transporter (DMT)-like permease
MRSRLDRAAVPLLSVVFVPLWASGFIAGKLATQRMDVATTLLWRFVVAALVMGVVVALTRPARPRGRAWLHLVVTALLLQVGQFSAVYSGLSLGVSAGLSSLVLGMAPLLVGLLTPVLLAERLGVAPVLGLVIGAAGVYVVLSDELGGGRLGVAVVLPVLGMLALTAGTLYQKRFGADTAISMSVTVQMLTSLAVLLVVMPFTGAQWLPPTFGAWAAAIWLGVFNSALAFAAMFVLLRRVSTVHVSALLNLVPATVAFGAVPILGEALTPQAVIGLGIALAGMYVGLGMLGRRSARPEVPHEDRERYGSALTSASTRTRGPV